MLGVAKVFGWRSPIGVGKSSARVTARARILLKSNDGWAAPKVAEALVATVYRIKPTRKGWTGPCGTGARSTGTASWTTGAKPT